MSILYPFNVLIPKMDYIQNWPVIACDQFTSQPEHAGTVLCVEWNAAKQHGGRLYRSPNTDGNFMDVISAIKSVERIHKILGKEIKREVVVWE